MARLQRRLIRHRRKVAYGAALLFGVWLLLAGYGLYERWQDRGRLPPGAGGPSMTMAAKRELAGIAVGQHHRLDERLLQVARTMPEIGEPAEPPGQGARAPDDGPETARSEHAAVDIEPAAAAPIPRQSPIAPAPSPPEEVGTPAPTSSEADDGAGNETVVARLEAPAALMPSEIAEEGAQTWLRNAVAPVTDDRPAIALVIDDLGWNRRAAAAINQLPGPMTLAFLPYGPRLEEQARAARAAGHELLVHVPMEPRGPESPGPNALTSELEPAELVSQLGIHLRSFRGFVGINNHMGSLLTTDPERMAIVMAELRRRGLLFLDSRTAPGSVAARTAARMGVPHAERDVFIDNELDLESVLRELARTERIARDHGDAVAIGHPHDVTLQALRTWLPTLEARGIALVPISTIAARRSCARGVLLAETCARYAVAATAVPAATTVPIGQ